MSDLYCQVCEEPFEHYHVEHEMEETEKDYFLDGFGCDRCKGKVPPDGISVLSQIMTAAMESIGKEDLDGVATHVDDYASFPNNVIGFASDRYDGGVW